MEEAKLIHKIGVAILKDKKILLARDYRQEKKFYIPGGKIEQGESEIECIKREIMEELSSRVDEKSVNFINEFTGPAHGWENTLVHIKLYSVKLLDEPKPSREIAEIRYFDSSISEENITETGALIFPFLIQEGYIK